VTVTTQLRSIRWNSPPAVVIFGAALFLGLLAFWIITGLGPDRLPYLPASEFSDAVTSHWPNALFLRRTVREDHTWPLWRPLLMSGQPFAANPLNKAWYPLQWLVIVLPPALHLNVLAGLHLLLAGTGAWAWGRETGLQPWPAALAGFGYAFAPRVMATFGAGHLDIVYALGWFPWLLWAVQRTVQPAPARHAVVWLALFGSLSVLADMRLSVYIFMTAGVYALWRWRQITALRAWADVRKVLLTIGSAALLVLGLTAIQWMPLLLMAGDLSRADMTRNDAAVHSLEPGQWLGLLLGDHGGTWETLVYAGVSTLVLVIVALVLQPRRFALWGGLLVFVALYAMGDNFVLWPLLTWLLPPLRWLRVPPRVWLVAALVMPYLAAWGAQLLAERPPDARRAVRLAVVGVLGGGIVCSVSSLFMLAPPLEVTTVLGTLALPLVMLGVALALFGKLSARPLMALFALVVIADVVWIDLALVEGHAKDEWLDPYAELADTLRADGAVRVYSPSYSLPQQAAAYWEIPQFGGVDPFQIAEYVVAAELATGVPVDGYSVTIPPYAGDGDEQDVLVTANRGAPLDADLLGRWLVTHVIAVFEIDADGLVLWSRVETPQGTVYVYRNMFARDVRLAWDGPNRVTVVAGSTPNGVIFPVAPGRWQDVDTPVLSVSGAASDATASFEYSRSEVWAGASMAGILITFGLAGWWMVRRA
jgi:hypothetical protein